MTHKNPQPSLNVGRQLDSNSRSVSYFQDLGLTFEHVCVAYIYMYTYICKCVQALTCCCCFLFVCVCVYAYN